MSGAADIDMLSCAAHFDGSGAGVDFYPAIQVLDEAGQVSATVIGPKVTAGDTADVTFAPFLKGQMAASTDPDALRYITDPQTGQWFSAEVTANKPGGYGWEFDDPLGNGTVFKGVPFFAGDVDETNNGALFSVRGNGIRFDLTGAQFFDVCEAYNGNRLFRLEQVVTGNKLAFFNVAPVAQQPTPVTLGDVIALLQAYGLAV